MDGHCKFDVGSDYVVAGVGVVGFHNGRKAAPCQWVVRFCEPVEPRVENPCGGGGGGDGSEAEAEFRERALGGCLTKRLRWVLRVSRFCGH